VVVMGVGMVGKGERGDPRPRPRLALKGEGSRLADRMPWKEMIDGTVASVPTFSYADVYGSGQNHLIISFLFPQPLNRGFFLFPQNL